MKVVLDISHTDLVSAIMIRYKKCIKNLLGDLSVIFLVIVLYLLIISDIVYTAIKSSYSIAEVFFVVIFVALVLVVLFRSWLFDIWVQWDDYKQYRRLLGMGAKELHDECLKDSDTVCDYEYQFRLFKKLSEAKKLKFSGVVLKDGYYKVHFECDKHDDYEYIKHYEVSDNVTETVLLLGLNKILLFPKTDDDIKSVTLEDKGAYSFYLDR